MGRPSRCSVRCAPASTSASCPRSAPTGPRPPPSAVRADARPRGARPCSWCSRSKNGGYALAWEVETRTATDVRLSYVDASRGSMLLDYSTLRTLEAQGPVRALVVDLKGDTARAADIRRSGATPQIPDAASAADIDCVAAAARTHAIATDEYFRQRFARAGIDGTRIGARRRRASRVVRPVADARIGLPVVLPRRRLGRTDGDVRGRPHLGGGTRRPRMASCRRRARRRGARDLARRDGCRQRPHLPPRVRCPRRSLRRHHGRGG